MPLTSPPYVRFPADAHCSGSRKRTVDYHPEYIVIHTTECSLDDALRRFRDPAQQVSAHWGISSTGGVVQWVTDDAAAYATGNADMNRRSISIELEAHAAAGDFTEAQLATLEHLIAWECQTHAIPINRERIIGHAEVPDPEHPGLFGGINRHTDPGPLFPWERLIAHVGELVV